jgi:hypothetical protein
MYLLYCYLAALDGEGRLASYIQNFVICSQRRQLYYCGYNFFIRTAIAVVLSDGSTIFIRNDAGEIYFTL